MKKILVFGTGFLAKNIFSNCKSNDYIISISKENSFAFSNKHYKCDFANFKKIISILKSEKVNQIFFFLGPTFPSNSFKNSKNDSDTYLLPFLHILESSSKLNVENFVMLSSAGTIYGSEQKIKYQEDKTIHQENAYGIILQTMESFLVLYAKTLGFSYNIFRLSNVFGQFHESSVNGFINIAIRKTLNGETVSMYNSSIEKNYIFAYDVAVIFWKLIEKINKNEVINISSDDNLSLNDIYYKISKQLSTIKIKKIPLDIKYDTKHTLISNEKLKKLINFEFTSFDKALIKTIEWEQKKIK